MRPVDALETQSAARQDRGRSHDGLSFRLQRHLEMDGGPRMRFSTLRWMQSSAAATVPSESRDGIRDGQTDRQTIHYYYY